MPTNATAEHVAVVLKAFAEEFLVDVPAVYTTDGAFISITVLEDALINADKEWLGLIADHINNGTVED